MTESEFLLLAGHTLSRIEEALEQAGLDFEQPADGILEIELSDGGKIVVNRHVSAREIWVAAPSGGFHFRHDGQVWRDSRDQAELFFKLSELVASEDGGKLVFD